MHRPESAARRGFVVPALWAAAIEARRAEFERAGEASRERRRADERDAWLTDLLASFDRVADSVGAQLGAALRPPIDPLTALAGVVAIAAAWADAMDDPGRNPAAIG